MGYMSHGRCFQTKAEATDYKMSFVVPSSLIYPIKKNDGWYYLSTKIEINHPACNPIAEFKAGQQIGMSIVILFAIAFVFKFIFKMIQNWIVSESNIND